MRNDKKQKEQIEIVEILNSIYGFKWFVVAGRLLKIFECQIIVKSLESISENCKQTIIQIMKEDQINRIYPYLTKVIRNNSPKIYEQFAYKQQIKLNEDLKNLEREIREYAELKKCF